MKQISVVYHSGYGHTTNQANGIVSGIDSVENVSALERMRKVFRTPGDCWLCEEYAKVIHDRFIEHNLTSLPLSPELSKEIWKSL